MQCEELGGKKREILGKIKGKVGGRGKEGKRKKRERAREGVPRFMLYIAQIIIISSCKTPTQLLHPF